VRAAKDYNLRMAAPVKMDNAACSPEVLGTARRRGWEIYIIVSRALNRLIGAFCVSRSVLLSEEFQSVESVGRISDRAAGHDDNRTNGSDGE
jgi:hypothetical protein